MSPFKRAAVKGGGSKGKEPIIEVNDFSPKVKRTRSPSRVFNPNKFRSYAAFQNHENYFCDATPLLERPVDQFSLHDTKIPQWFAHNGLLTKRGSVSLVKRGVLAWSKGEEII